MFTNSKRKAPTKDHVKPKCSGGTKTVFVCFECNNRKAHTPPWIWFAAVVKEKPYLFKGMVRAYMDGGMFGPRPVFMAAEKKARSEMKRANVVID